MADGIVENDCKRDLAAESPVETVVFACHSADADSG